jgi:large subunit ribosomal protein L22
MEFKAYIKNVKISPKKLRFFLPAIKKLTPKESLDYLFYMPNKAAKILYKAIKSAIDNAKNISKTREGLLKFKLLAVEEGLKLKRYRPGGRGTVKPFERRYSHIKIVLEDSSLIGEKKQEVQSKLVPLEQKKVKNTSNKNKKNIKVGTKVKKS